jgi:hypothetical protein
MDEIVPRVNRVTDITSEISAANPMAGEGEQWELH